MPLTSKGNKIMSHMKEEYGAKKGEKVFYASKNKGNISGVDSRLDSIITECDSFANKHLKKK